MNLILEVNNLSGCNFDEKKLKLTVEKTINKTRWTNFFKKDVFVSAGFISEQEIQKINKQYRDKDYPTDILSFANFESADDLEKSKEENIFLGELLICLPDIQKYCQKKDISFEREFYKVFSHGILHLLGFNHNKEMFRIQKEVSLEV